MTGITSVKLVSSIGVLFDRRRTRGKAGFLEHGAERSRRQAFTLLELITVILVLAIFGVMALPVLAHIQDKLARSRCLGNLRSLHVAAGLYLQDHRAWPQIKNAQVSREDLAKAWIARLQPYGLEQINWICPTIQSQMGSPDLTDLENRRVDYTATPFDSNPQTPFRWAKQPWFVENGNMHGNGNLLVFPDGHVQELNDFLQGEKKSSPASH